MDFPLKLQGIDSSCCFYYISKSEKSVVILPVLPKFITKLSFWYSDGKWICALNALKQRQELPMEHNKAPWPYYVMEARAVRQLQLWPWSEQRQIFPRGAEPAALQSVQGLWSCRKHTQAPIKPYPAMGHDSQGDPLYALLKTTLFVCKRRKHLVAKIIRLSAQLRDGQGEVAVAWRLVSYSCRLKLKLLSKLWISYFGKSSQFFKYTLKTVICLEWIY